MSECNVVRESMPQLLTESMDRGRRELSHQHIESCSQCTEEWNAYRETWTELAALPEVQPPAHLRARFLASIGQHQSQTATVVPFHRRSAFKWLAQAAAVVLLAGGGYFAGNRTTSVRIAQTPASIASVQPAPYSIAETRVLPASAVSPDFQGRPNIQNWQVVDSDASDNKIGVAFDVTSRVTVTGSPRDKSMVRLLSYALADENLAMSPSRSRTIDLVRQTYSDPANAEPEISDALAKVLRNDQHEGVRIRAIDTLKTLPAASADTRQALIDALNHDPNPSVRMKAVEALANIARSGTALDAATVDTLRQKALQENENLYVRTKAAEALSSIRPQ